jgi:glycosyltransferase involved in cell wall biosynthesis
VTVVPTVIDTDRYAIAAQRAADAPVRVGWSGSDQSIAAALFPFLPMLEALQEKLGFEFIVITNTRPVLPVSRLRFTFVPWKAEEEGELGRHMDVGLMPLVDDPFQRGKCGLKLLQYMAAGLPTVASPVGVNAEIVIKRETGFLARCEEDWGAALAELVHSANLRQSMGRHGRRRCDEHYSIRRWLPELIKILTRAASSGPAKARLIA